MSLSLLLFFLPATIATVSWTASAFSSKHSFLINRARSMTTSWRRRRIKRMESWRDREREGMEREKIRVGQMTKLVTLDWSLFMPQGALLLELSDRKYSKCIDMINILRLIYLRWWSNRCEAMECSVECNSRCRVLFYKLKAPVHLVIVLLSTAALPLSPAPYPRARCSPPSLTTLGVVGIQEELGHRPACRWALDVFCKLFLQSVYTHYLAEV